MSLTGRIAKRIRRGVERRADRVLDRLGLKPARAAAPVSPFANEAPPAPVVEAVPEAAPVAEADDTAGLPLITWEQVQALFEDSVRPALQSDGGDITLVRVQDNDVFVELTGACHTCPSSIITMQNGIQRLLEEEFPQFGRLVRVDGPEAD